MNRALIWNLPVRVFHWAFAVSAAGAFVIAVGTGHESPLFPFHMLLGLTAAALLAARVLIALAGDRHHRFRDLLFSPIETAKYLAGSLLGSASRYAGHNPGTAIVALAMFVLVPLLVWTGVNMSQGGEGAEELHEVLANLLLAAMLIHLAGLALHTVRHRENIAWSMVDGRKVAPSETAIASPRRAAGLLLLIAAVAWVLSLNAGYDTAAGTVTLPVVGTVIRLGEAESGEENEEGSHRDARAEGEHEDDDRD